MFVMLNKVLQNMGCHHHFVAADKKISLTGMFAASIEAWYSEKPGAGTKAPVNPDNRPTA